MKNNDYWIKRRAKMMYENMEIAEKAADEIAKQYLSASKYVEESLKKIFNNSKTGLNVSNNDVKQVLKKVKEGDINEIIRNSKSLGKSVMAEYLERPDIKRKFTKLTELNNQIDTVISNMNVEEYIKVNKALKNIAGESYNKSIFNIQQQTGLGFSFNKFDRELYDKIIKSKWSGENYSKRIWNRTQDLADTVKSEMLQGFMCGKTYKEMTPGVQDDFSASAVNARRLIRTEGNYVSNEFEMQSYDECGIDKYIFVATLDLKTSEMCAALDGKVFNVKDAVPGINMPPMHPWCRSTTISYIGDNELSNMKRRARNPKTGKNEIVPADMTYIEWKKKYVDKPDMEVKTPKIKDIKMKKAYDELDTVLANSEGNDMMVNRLIIASDTINYIEDNSLTSAFAYLPDEDIIKYNSKVNNFDLYDLNYVQVHELSHRVDINEIQSWKNTRFYNAIENSKKIIYTNKKTIINWFKEGGKYSDDVAMSDIISALSQGDMNDYLIAGHSREYWQQNSRNVSLKVFANIASIDTLGSASKSELITVFKELFSVYEELIK